jgi:hypothetical protein
MDRRQPECARRDRPARPPAEPSPPDRLRADRLAARHPDAFCRIRSAALAFDKSSQGVWASDHFGVVVDLEIGHQA